MIGGGGGGRHAWPDAAAQTSRGFRRQKTGCASTASVGEVRPRGEEGVGTGGGGVGRVEGCKQRGLMTEEAADVAVDEQCRRQRVGAGRPRGGVGPSVASSEFKYHSS